MFNINFLPNREFKVQYLKKNHPNIWQEIKPEIDRTIKDHLSHMVFAIFISIFFIVIINTATDLKENYSIRLLFSISCIVFDFFVWKMTYQEIIHWNAKYFGVPYISYEIVTEMRNAAFILKEEKILNDVVGSNMIQNHIKSITKKRI